MGIAALALRYATVGALRGVTLAEDRVADSRRDPLDTVGAGEPLPALAVYTEDSSVIPDGKDLSGGERSLQLVLEFVVAKRVQLEAGGTDVFLSETDTGLEGTLDLLERQVLAALQGGPGAWASLWRRLVLGVTKIEGRRGASAEGVRWSARQLVLTVQPVAEPAFGRDPEGVWAAFIATLAEDDGCAELAQAVAGLIRGDAAPGWRQAQAWLGLTDDGVRGLNIAPVDTTEAGEPAALSEIDITGDDGIERPVA